MLEALGTVVLGYIERELVKHEPEIQELIVGQLDKLAVLLFDYVQQKTKEVLSPPSSEDFSQADIPQ